MNRTEKNIKTESEILFEFISLPQKLLDKAIVVLVHKVLLHQNYFVRAYQKYQSQKLALYPSERLFKMEDGKDHIKYFDVCDDLQDGTLGNLALYHLQSIISNPTELIPTCDDDNPEKGNDEIQNLDFVDFNYEKLFEQEGPLMAKVWLYHFEIQINWLRQHRQFGHYQSLPFIIEPKWFGYNEKFAEYQKNKMKNMESKYE